MRFAFLRFIALVGRKGCRGAFFSEMSEAEVKHWSQKAVVQDQMQRLLVRSGGEGGRSGGAAAGPEEVLPTDEFIDVPRIQVRRVLGLWVTGVLSWGWLVAPTWGSCSNQGPQQCQWQGLGRKKRAQTRLHAQRGRR